MALWCVVLLFCFVVCLVGLLCWCCVFVVVVFGVPCCELVVCWCCFKLLVCVLMWCVCSVACDCVCCSALSC